MSETSWKILELFDEQDKWTTSDIAQKLDMNIDDAKVTKSNIAYNLQYLEFIEKEINDLDLHIVLQKMLYKTYIILSI